VCADGEQFLLCERWSYFGGLLQQSPPQQDHAPVALASVLRVRSATVPWPTHATKS